MCLTLWNSMHEFRNQINPFKYSSFNCVLCRVWLFTVDTFIFHFKAFVARVNTIFYFFRFAPRQTVFCISSKYFGRATKCHPQWLLQDSQRCRSTADILGTDGEESLARCEPDEVEYTFIFVFILPTSLGLRRRVSKKKRADSKLNIFKSLIFYVKLYKTSGQMKILINGQFVANVIVS